LIEIWLSAPDRSAIAAAVNAIDRQLAHDAHAKGSELSEGLQTLVELPLKVLFVVRDEDRIVEVLRVKWA
jgi:hypothetical protein